MERKKRVSVGVVLMGFFLLVVMLAGVAGLIKAALKRSGQYREDEGGDI